MKLSVEYLKNIDACSEAVKAFSEQKETDAVKVLKLCVVKNWHWANWLLVRLLDRPNSIRYAVFATQQILYLYENKYPSDKQPRKAVEAAMKVIEKDTSKTRTAAAIAGSAVAEMRTKIFDYGIELFRKQEAK